MPLLYTMILISLPFLQAIHHLFHSPSFLFSLPSFLFLPTISPPLLSSFFSKVMVVSADRDPDLLKAAAVSLGMLGVVTEVTLQCEDAFFLEETTINHPLNFCIEHFNELARSAQHVKFWMELNSEVCSVYSGNRTLQQPHTIPPQPLTNVKVKLSVIYTAVLSSLLYLLYLQN